MLNFHYKDKYGFDDLVDLMVVLRKECPWDREQTHKSIRGNFIEETYEAVEAIDTEDTNLLREELGDVLLQVIFHACMEEEDGHWNISDVCDEVCKKLIHRHPHIFANENTTIGSAEEVLEVWESVKREEKGGGHVNAVERVAKSLPALMRAEKILGRAKKAGFDFETSHAVWDKLYEEMSELRAATGQKSAEDELGDILLTVVSLARFLGIDAEQALYKASDKFTRRFTLMDQISENGMASLSRAELDGLWAEAKKLDRERRKKK